MPKAAIQTLRLGRADRRTPLRDIFAIPILACAYALIVSPLLLFFTSTPGLVGGLMETRHENKIVWPTLAAIAGIVVVRNLSRRPQPVWPPHIIWLAAYLVLAGASVLWAFSPYLSFVRFVQQAMIVTCIILPAVFAVRRSDLMQGLFMCFAMACLLNVYFVYQGYQTVADRVIIGYQGYFQGKNYLGECTAVALLLSLHEMTHPGRRRAMGLTFAVVSVSLLLLSDSKTALGLAFLAPSLAVLALIIRRLTRISPAMLPLLIVFCYLVLSSVSNFSMNRISYMLYGDPTFTGRQIIWDFVVNQIGQRPFLGWGYQSFWLVGSDSPSILGAPGWVKGMPNAHNGYYDTILETGYVGFTLLIAFIIATLHSIGRVADREPPRAALLLSLAFFIIMYNGLESIWMRGFEFLWVVFLIVAAETARYSEPLRRRDRSPLARRYSPGPRRPGPAVAGAG
jgi:O-antigen ligase